MSMSLKILPVLALVIALAPFAAQAKPSQPPVQGNHHTVVHSGGAYFRDFFGG